jgi:hypothetical protein
MIHSFKNDGPIFIVGAPRSGTTLLQYMLRSHPRISLPTGESHFMVPIYQNRLQYGDLKQPQNIESVLKDMYRKSREFLETDLHGIRFEIESMTKLICQKGCLTIPDVFSTIYEENARGEGKVRWGEKTPWYLLHMPLILEMFSNVQFVHIIRDGRDVALSLFNRRHDFGVYNIFNAAEYWTGYLERGQKLGAQLKSTAYHEVRYEDLLEKPHETVRRICDFLGEKYSERVVDYKTSTVAGKTPLLLKPIQKSNAYKWKKQLRRRQIETFESVAGTILARNGYELATSGQPISLLEKALYRGHNAFCNLIYRKKWTGMR